MTPVPVPRYSAYNPTVTLNGTWLECESFAYPAGGFTRRAYVVLRRNPNNPILLPYGEKRIVYCSIPDTYYSIPGRLTSKGRTVRGFISVAIGNDGSGQLTFTPLSKATHTLEEQPCTCDACKARRKTK